MQTVGWLSMRNLAVLALAAMLTVACSPQSQDTAGVDTTLNDEDTASSLNFGDASNATDANSDFAAANPDDGTSGYEDEGADASDTGTQAELDAEAMAAAGRVRAAAGESDGGDQSRPAIGDPTDWITVDDYPPSSIRAEEEGVTAVSWIINTSGRVENCQVTESSGSSALDMATCRALTRRGRYQPALDSYGDPVASSGSRRVTWRLPQ